MYGMFCVSHVLNKSIIQGIVK